MYVRGKVLRQIVGPGETLTAHLAVVGPLTRVYPQVPGEVTLTTESPTAEQADERTLTRMLADMKLEVLLGTDALSAEGAGEAALASISVMVVMVAAVITGSAADGQVEAGRLEEALVVHGGVLSVAGSGASVHVKG